MSRPDFNKYRESLLAAHKEVFDTGNPTDWALFTYEGQTNVIKLVSKGDGGLEEMSEDLSGGRIMYAYLSVQDPNTKLPKYVLINWQGEGVPEVKKGQCANHMRDISTFFRGAHVTINARREEDIEEEQVLDKVSKSSGCNYSFHKETARPAEPVGPVGSVYKKTKPHIEIKGNARDKFWEKQRIDEQKRQEEDQQRLASDKSSRDVDTKQREKQESIEREKREQERLKKIQDMREAERRANEQDTTQEKAKWEVEQRSALTDAEERGKRGDVARRQRAAEAKSLVSQRGDDPRSRFEQKHVSQFDEPSSAPAVAAPPTRKLKHSFMDEPQEQTARKQPIQLPHGEDTSPPATSPASPPATRSASPPAARPASPPATSPTSPPARPFQPPPARVPSPQPDEEEDDWQTEAAPASPPPAAVPLQSSSGQPQTRNLLQENLPPRQESDEEDNAQDWDDSRQPPPVTSARHEPSGEDFSFPGSADNHQVAAPSSPPPVEDVYDDVSAPVGAGDQGQCARALYDYQAGEDNEITFDPGDLITNVDQIDPGWWVGTGPDGKQGMFPANYVELM